LFGGQGELFEILEDDKSLPEAQVQAIAKQLVSLSSSCLPPMRQDCHLPSWFIRVFFSVHF
jgi:hypothetical protein